MFDWFYADEPLDEVSRLCLEDDPDLEFAEELFQ